MDKELEELMHTNQTLISLTKYKDKDKELKDFLEVKSQLNYR